ANRFYQLQLRQHPQAGRARDYLKGRGLSGEIARDYELGFAPPGWTNLLDALGDTPASRELLTEAGLLIAKDDGKLYDRFRDRVMFPIRDNRGRVIAFGGRVLGDDKPKYLNSPETPIFHKGRELYGLYQARKRHRHLPRMLVVEGYMDVVALAQHGIGWAGATLGTATSEEHLQKLFRHVHEVVFCFDGDDAGRRAATRALETCLPAMIDGRQARFLFLPEGEDPDTLVRREGAAAFEQRVSQALPLERYLFDSLSTGLDLATMEGRARLSKAAAPLLQTLPDGVYRSLMFQELGRLTGLSPQQLQAAIAQPAPALEPASSIQHTPTAPGERQYQHDRETARPPRARPPMPRRDEARNPVLYALGLLILFPQLAQTVADDLELDHLSGDDASLLREVLALLRRRPESSTHMLLGQWWEEPAHSIISRAIKQTYFIPRDGAARELTDTLKHLQSLRTRQDLDRLVDKFRGSDYAALTESQLAELEQLRQLLQRKHSK
ncbi:MAG: DNA primase, partial [Spongiibacteraceae bacterium]|nr:DNA primase [Spongiibacteraceae bacterium]